MQKDHNMGLRIIRADASHMGVIMALEEACFSSPWPLEFVYEDMCINKNLYYIIMLNGKAIGYASMWIVVDEAHINNICIHPDYREHGYGKTLLRYIIDIARELGASSMMLEVRVSNAPAIEMYKDFGFTIDGVRKQYYQDSGEDAYIMFKEGVQHEG